MNRFILFCSTVKFRKQILCFWHFHACSITKKRLSRRTQISVDQKLKRPCDSIDFCFIWLGNIWEWKSVFCWPSKSTLISAEKPAHSCSWFQNAAAQLLKSKHNRNHIALVLTSRAHSYSFVKLFMLFQHITFHTKSNKTLSLRVFSEHVYGFIQFSVIIKS